MPDISAACHCYLHQWPGTCKDFLVGDISKPRLRGLLDYKTYIHIGVCTYIHIGVSTYIHIGVCTYIHIGVCTYIHIGVSTYIHIGVCTCKKIYDLSCCVTNRLLARELPRVLNTCLGFQTYVHTYVHNYVCIYIFSYVQ